MHGLIVTPQCAHGMCRSKKPVLSFPLFRATDAPAQSLT